MGIDFLATIAAGGGIGWLADYWQNWWPYGLVVGCMLGFVVATIRIIQRSNADDKAAAERKRLGK
jgi:F0F1-type ATP synthase assembly protein I